MLNKYPYFIESISCRDGTLELINYHQARIEKVSHYLGLKHIPVVLSTLTIPSIYRKGHFKCRLVYSDILHEVTFTSYEIMPITSLKLVINNTIDYRYKYHNRKQLNTCYDQRGDQDDIVIVKNGCLTDTWYANIIVHKKGILYTPKEPLLAGVFREFLLDQKRIVPIDIYFSQEARQEVLRKGGNSKEEMLILEECNKIQLINAMMQFDGPQIDIKNSVYPIN